jgi:hypothetical protein
MQLMDEEKESEYRRAVEDLEAAVKDLRSDFVDWEAAFERVTAAKERLRGSAPRAGEYQRNVAGR